MSIDLLHHSGVAVVIKGQNVCVEHEEAHSASTSSSSCRRFFSIASRQDSKSGSSRRYPASCFHGAGSGATLISASVAPALTPRPNLIGQSVNSLSHGCSFGRKADRKTAGANRSIAIARDRFNDDRYFHKNIPHSTLRYFILPSCEMAGNRTIVDEVAAFRPNDSHGQSPASSKKRAASLAPTPTSSCLK
jgi:hypothetical protein